jgi:hypothetical protein
MNDKMRPLESPIGRACLSFFLATVAANMTCIPFIAVVYFEKVFPAWVLFSVLFVGIFLSVLVGFKCFRWFYRYFEKL